MKKILVTGSNGLLGQKLIVLLAKNPDIEVIATARGQNRLPIKEGYEYYSMDITNGEEIEAVVSKTRPNAIIHAAAMTNVDQCEFEKDNCWAQNVKAVEDIVNVCTKYDIFLCHVSTDFIFDGVSGPYSEDAEANPLSFYGWSKLAAEFLIKKSTIRWAIARTVLVYGIAFDMSRSNIILWVKKSLEEGKNIKVVTDQWRTPTLAEDLAIGTFLITENETEGIFNISGKDLLTPHQMAIMTADFFKLDKSLIASADSTTFSQPARRPAKTGFILEKANKVLGYKPHSFKEGIEILANQLNL